MMSTTEGTTPQTDPLTEWVEAIADLFVDALTEATESPEREHELTDGCWCQPTVEHVEPELPLSVGDEVLIDGEYPAVVEVADPDVTNCVVLRVTEADGYSGWQVGELVKLSRRRVQPRVLIPGDRLVTVDMPDGSRVPRITITVAEADALATCLDVAILAAGQEAA